MTQLKFDLISFSESLKKIEKNLYRLAAIKIPVEQAAGMYSVVTIKSKIDIPEFNVSAMDGYAIKYGKSIYEIDGYIHPGRIIKPDLSKAYEVGTGAVLIELDTVIPYEEAAVKDGRLYVENANKYDNLRLKGEILKKGRIILKKNELITHGKIMLLAGCGVKYVRVIKKPDISIISTGDELLNPAARVFDSNIKFLVSILEKYGRIIDSITIKDNYEVILNKIKNAIKKSDIVITTGGVSKGKKDFVKKAMLENGVKIIFHGVNIKPAKPMLFGVKGRKLIFGLPGNPVSAFVGTHLYIIPAIKKIMGGEFKLNFQEYILASKVSSDKERDTFILSVEKNGKLTPLKGGSHNILAPALATHIAFLEKNKTLKRAPAIDINGV